MVRSTTLLPLVLVALSGCVDRPGAGRPSVPSDDALLALARRRDFFALRDSIAAHQAVDVPMLRFARGLVSHAFNQLAESNRHIAQARQGGGLPDSLIMVLGAMEVTNDLRLFQYRSGLAAADALIAAPPAGADSTDIADVANLAKILRALEGVPPQRVVRRDSATLRLVQGLIPIRIQGVERQYVFDTGANLSTLSRSEARSLGLRILPADIDVGSSTDVRNRADLAVADSLIIGGTRLDHVVFLVFDDRLLTFPGMTIRGIVGFPVIEALGEVGIRADGTIALRGPATVRSTQNLALDGHTPLTAIRWRGERSLCRLDTGANQTDFYQPFYRRYRKWIDSSGTLDTTTTGGVGGLRQHPVIRVKGIRIEVGDTAHSFPEIAVMTTSVVRTEADNFLDCNLGHDVFDAYSEYGFDFQTMRFFLR